MYSRETWGGQNDTSFLPSHRVFILHNCNVTFLGWMSIYSINLTPFNFTPFSLLPIGYFPASLLHFSQPSLQLLTLPPLIRSFYVQIMLHLAPLGSTFTPLDSTFTPLGSTWLFNQFFLCTNCAPPCSTKLFNQFNSFGN